MAAATKIAQVTSREAQEPVIRVEFGLFDLSGKERRNVVAVKDPKAHDQARQRHDADIGIDDHAVGLGEVNTSGVTASAHKLVPGGGEGILGGCAELEVQHDPGEQAEEEADFQDAQDGASGLDHQDECDRRADACQ